MKENLNIFLFYDEEKKLNKKYFKYQNDELITCLTKIN